MITESVAVESINLLLCWNTIGFYIAPLQRHYCNDNTGVARSFPERCNLERPYNMLWALTHNFESVSGRAANEICFDWRTSISHSQTIPLTCAQISSSLLRQLSPACPHRKQMQFAYGSVECGHDIMVYLSGN